MKNRTAPNRSYALLGQPYSVMLGGLRNVSIPARLINAIDDRPAVRAFLPVDSAFKVGVTAGVRCADHTGPLAIYSAMAAASARIFLNVRPFVRR